jgi:hypothetical protein
MLIVALIRAGEQRPCALPGSRLGVGADPGYRDRQDQRTEHEPDDSTSHKGGIRGIRTNGSSGAAAVSHDGVHDVVQQLPGEPLRGVDVADLLPFRLQHGLDLDRPPGLLGLVVVTLVRRSATG